MRLNDIPQIARLSTPEKILLVEDFWESIAGDEASVPVPPSHREELHRRFEKYQADPGRLLSLEELQDKVGESTFRV